MVRAPSLLLFPLLAACPSDSPLLPETGDEPAASTGGDAPTSAATSGTGGAATTGATGPATTSITGVDTGTTESMFEPPEVLCGNGYLEAGEECDDGNDVEDDGCTTTCEIPCGLEREYIELAPSAQSVIEGARVLGAPDGGVVVVGSLQKITLDMEGMQDNGPRQLLVIAYDAAGDKRWEQTLSATMGDLDRGGAAIDGDGDVIVAGSADAADGIDVWVRKLAAADGKAVWTVTHDGTLADSDDVPRGLAVTSEGDVIVSAQVYDVDQDSDVWVRKLDADDGATLWTTTWSGTPDNGFSIDRGHHVAVDADDNVFVLAREYVNFKRFETTLLKFGSTGGEPLWTATPLADGTDHTHEPSGLAVDAAGDVVFSVSRYGVAPSFWLYKYASNGDPVWDLARADFATSDDEWTTYGVALSTSGDLLVGGYWYNEDKTADASWYEAWVARLDGDGTRRCQVSARGVSDDIIPPSLLAYDIGGGADDVALVTGRRLENGEDALWTALFRPL